jgi:osmotically-inducible protein OsmY
MERLRKYAWRKERMAKRRKSVKQQVGSEDFSESATTPSAKGGCMTLIDSPHQVERDVRRELLSQPELRFSSLVVRRVGRGAICLEGVLETTAGKAPDVSGLAQRVAGVDRVLNRLVVRSARKPALSAQSN